MCYIPTVASLSTEPSHSSASALRPPKLIRNAVLGPLNQTLYLILFLDRFILPLFMCMFVCLCICTCVFVSTGSGRGQQTTWSWSYRWAPEMWILEIEFGFYARAESSLNPWVSSPALRLCILVRVHNHSRFFSVLQSLAVLMGWSVTGIGMISSWSHLYSSLRTALISNLLLNSSHLGILRNSKTRSYLRPGEFGHWGRDMNLKSPLHGGYVWAYSVSDRHWLALKVLEVHAAFPCTELRVLLL